MPTKCAGDDDDILMDIKSMRKEETLRMSKHRIPQGVRDNPPDPIEPPPPYPAAVFFTSMPIVQAQARKH